MDVWGGMQIAKAGFMAYVPGWFYTTDEAVDIWEA